MEITEAMKERARTVAAPYQARIAASKAATIPQSPAEWPSIDAAIAAALSESWGDAVSACSSSGMMTVKRKPYRYGEEWRIRWSNLPFTLTRPHRDPEGRIRFNTALAEDGGTRRAAELARERWR